MYLLWRTELIERNTKCVGRRNQKMKKIKLRSDGSHTGVSVCDMLLYVVWLWQKCLCIWEKATHCCNSSSEFLLIALDTEGKKFKGLAFTDLVVHAEERHVPVLFMVAKWRQNRNHVCMEYFLFDHRIHPVSYDTYFWYTNYSCPLPSSYFPICSSFHMTKLERIDTLNVASLHHLTPVKFLCNL